MSESIHAPHNQSACVANKTNAAQLDSAEVQKSVSHITSPLLYMSGVDPAMTDKELAGTLFQHVLPVRPKIKRDNLLGNSASGTIEFETVAKAEKAYATVSPLLQLRISPTDIDPVAQANSRLVKHLPLHADNAMVYDLFRPFGALKCVQCVRTNPAGVHVRFKGVALLDFYSEEDAQRAQNKMHCTDIQGNTITITTENKSMVEKQKHIAKELKSSCTILDPVKHLNVGAPVFSPSSRNVPSGSNASIHAPKGRLENQSDKENSGLAGQISQPLDPCNLYIKNLDADIDTNELFNAFRRFGHIVSARVMRDVKGKSRQFGFVSYTAPAEATRALREMDNVRLRSKTITVCLHEPKNLRQEKLEAHFAASKIAEADFVESASPAEEGSSKESSLHVELSHSKPDTGTADASDKGPTTSATAALLGVPVQSSISSASSSADDASIVSSGRSASDKERERLLTAVISISDSDAPVEDITDMLVSLPRKDRALCLFNSDTLKTKVDEAREILELTDESAEDLAPATPTHKQELQAPLEQKARNIAEPPLTFSALAVLPASEILRLINQTESQYHLSLPLPKPDVNVLRATDEFIDSLADKPSHDQKQKLGDLLFKKIRTFCIKGAPKITIHLLDTEDLRSLAHLMNSYEAVLREKVLQTAATGVSK